ncbi:transcription initiation factor IIF subunit alpha-like [Nicotiana tabacum]|uniref:Transcription initiation factor IIF subunit alpha n=3 Tax=Nicotiana TaxID=4085 RepID=A0A1S4AF13_TOBAC|nr:PREDICTED: transcription initiation factor IIF subunit alpha-like [Nicotiana sylvestris]XP_016475209.1 PREDICTED: transcription initiation factor IIF subunit alpha-like [Nicotiana tabacum]
MRAPITRFIRDAIPVKDEYSSTANNSVLIKCASPFPKTTQSPATGPVTEDEIRAFLMQRKQVTKLSLVSKFKSRLKCREDKIAFANVLRRISKIQKTGTASYVVLQDAIPVEDESSSTANHSFLIKRASPFPKTAQSLATGPVTEDEIRAFLLQRKSVTTLHLVSKFKSRLQRREDKAAFADVLKRITKIQKTGTTSYVVLRERLESNTQVHGLAAKINRLGIND